MGSDDGAWEFDTLRQGLFRLVGHSHGLEPETQLEQIRLQRREQAEHICRVLAASKADVALELGSGCGFASKHVAAEVAHLHCCDISHSFLAMAREECAAIPNVSFHHIQNLSLGFAADESIDCIFANAVFIHLNLFEIHAYLGEFARVLRQGGRVWFDIANADAINMDLFLRMAGHYQQHPERLPSLVKWTSPASVRRLADHRGFAVAASDEPSQFLLIRGNR